MQLYYTNEEKISELFNAVISTWNVNGELIVDSRIAEPTGKMRYESCDGVTRLYLEVDVVAKISTDGFFMPM